jgi:hypothetical protein
LPVSQPVHERTAGTHVLTFEGEEILVKLDRIRENSRYEVHGEIMVAKAGVGRESHLHQARLNMTSTTARKTVADYCSERSGGVPTKEDWRGLIEMACLLVISAHREGEPFLWLTEVEDESRNDFLLSPAILDGRPQVLFADGGTGKTLLAHYWAVLIASGASANGFTATQGNVMILDYETDRTDTRDRISWIAKGLGIEVPQNIVYRYCHQAVADDVEVLGGFIQRNDIAFVMIDSANSAVGGEPESAESVSKYFTALRSFKVASLTLAHVSKSVGGSGGPFGSVFWRNYPRQVFELQSDQQPGEAQFTLGVSQVKTNWGQREPPIALSVAFDTLERSVVFGRTAAINMDKLKKKLLTKDKITRALVESDDVDGMTVRDIAKATEVGEASIRTTLNRGEGDIFTRQDGLWTLAQHTVKSGT